MAGIQEYKKGVKIHGKGKGHGFSNKCASLVKEQRARLYILRRCATMLLCWLAVQLSLLWEPCYPLFDPFGPTPMGFYGDSLLLFPQSGYASTFNTIHYGASRQ